MIKVLFLCSVLVFTSGWAPSAHGKSCGEGVALEPATIVAVGGLVTAIIIGSCNAIDQHQEEQRDMERLQMERERHEMEMERLRQEEEERERRQEEEERHEMEMERLRQEQKSAALIQSQSGWVSAMSKNYELERRGGKNRTFGISWNSGDRMESSFMWWGWGMNGISMERRKQGDDYDRPFRPLNLSSVTDKSDRLQALGNGKIDIGGLLNGGTVNSYYESLISDVSQSDKTWNTVGKYIFRVCDFNSIGDRQFSEYDDFTGNSRDWKLNKHIYNSSDFVDVQELICNPLGVSSDYRINLVIQEQVNETAWHSEGDYGYGLSREPQRNQKYLKRRIDPILREMAEESIVWFLGSEQEYQHRSYSDFLKLQNSDVGLENIRHLIRWINSMAWGIIKAKEDPPLTIWFGSPLSPEQLDRSQVQAIGGKVDGIYEPFTNDVPQFETWDALEWPGKSQVRVIRGMVDGIYEPFTNDVPQLEIWDALEEEPGRSQVRVVIGGRVDDIYELFTSDVPQFETGGALGHQTYQIHFIVQRRGMGIQGKKWNVIGGSTHRFNATFHVEGFLDYEGIR